MKLSIKILIPSLIVLFMGLFAVSFIAHDTTKSILNEKLISSTNFSLDAMVDQGIESNNQVEMITKIMSENFLQVTKLLSIYLGNSSEKLSTQEYIDLAEKIGVDEIHITDENGVLRWGSVEGFYNFDFRTSEQTKPFLKILSDPTYSLAQEPQLRGVDNSLFQYVSVSRIDKPGIVQIGVKASVLEEAIRSVDFQQLVDTYKVDNVGGYVFITSLEGVIEKHRDKKIIGIDLVKDYDWGKKLLESDSGSFYYRFKDANKFMSYRVVGDSIFCASVFVNPYIEPVKDMDRVLLITAIVVGFILLLVITLFLGRLVRRPLKELIEKIKILAEGEGDLTQEIIFHSNDEVGELASSINQFIISLKTIIGNIKLRSNETQKIKESLLDEAKDSAIIGSNISENVQDIKNNISKLDDEILESMKIEQSIEVQIEELDREIENQVSAVEESTASINEIVASLNNVSTITTNKYNATLKLVDITKTGGDKVVFMNNVVSEIHESVQQISSMVTLINDIASQTSLLSMNAAIEAAHAGDEGKGFAVVADEIRKLSESTGNNVASITKVLADIKSQVNEATLASSDTNNAFVEISSEVESVSQALSEINLSTAELSNGGEQILDAMYILQDVSSKVRNGASEMKDGAKNMSTAMNQVKNISKDVLGKVDRISRNSKSIADGADTINELSINLSDNTNDLNSEIQRFKTE